MESSWEAIATAQAGDIDPAPSGEGGQCEKEHRLGLAASRGRLAWEECTVGETDDEHVEPRQGTEAGV